MDTTKTIDEDTSQTENTKGFDAAHKADDETENFTEDDTGHDMVVQRNRSRNNRSHRARNRKTVQNLENNGRAVQGRRRGRGRPRKKVESSEEFDPEGSEEEIFEESDFSDFDPKPSRGRRGRPRKPKMGGFIVESSEELRKRR